MKKIEDMVIKGGQMTVTPDELLKKCERTIRDETLSNEEIVAWKTLTDLLTTIKEETQVNSEEGE